MVMKSPWITPRLKILVGPSESMGGGAGSNVEVNIVGYQVHLANDTFIGFLCASSTVGAGLAGWNYAAS